MQNLKVKMQNYKSKFKIINIFAFLIVIFTFAFLIFNSSTARAQSARYPIAELGNCGSGKECYFYCQIPQNTPACWSYGKYVMNDGKDVLGDTAINITYPIQELGNCKDANECFIYCNQPKNLDACHNFASKQGLIKAENEEEIPEQKMQEIITSAQTELGCNSKDTCMTLCSNPDNYAKCSAFASKHNLNRGGPPPDGQQMGPPPEVIEEAKTALGCDNPQTCMKFCDDPQNQVKCYEFAKKHNLIDKEEEKRREKNIEQKKEMLEEAKSELGCDSIESCAKFCGDPTNVEKCMGLGRRHGFAPPEDRKNPPPKPCANEAECKAYCEKHPEECKGFEERKSSFQDMNKDMKYPPISGASSSYSQNNNQPNYDQMNNSGNKKYPENKQGVFLGPGGCKTEGECKAYCEKHPNECPGFPKDKISPPQQFNTQSNSGQKPPTNPTYSQTNPQTNFRPPQPPENNNGSGKSNSGGGSFTNPLEYKPQEFESGKYESEHKN